MRAGTFREDLYYRLAIISIETPPLRHRKEDIPQLAAYCIREAAEGMGQPEVRLSRGALELMAAHDWPGNVRELKNCLTRAMAFVEEDLILPQHIVLEQDAFRAYGKPVSAQILAGKFKAEDFREPAGMPPPRRTAAGSQAEAQADQDGGDGSQHSPMGAGHAAEFLWPAPPRKAFTPARAEKEPGTDTGIRAGAGDDDGAVAPADRADGAERSWAEDIRGKSPVPPPGFGDAPPYANSAAFAGKNPGPAVPPRFVPAGNSGQDGGRNFWEQETSPGFSSIASAPLGEPPTQDRGAGWRFSPLPEAPGVLPHTGQNKGHAASYVPQSAGGRIAAEPDSGAIRGRPLPAPAELNERQMRGLEFLRVNGAMTRAQYEGIAGREFSARTAQNDLKELVELGVLERVGAGPGVRYTLRRHTGDS